MWRGGNNNLLFTDKTEIDEVLTVLQDELYPPRVYQDDGFYSPECTKVSRLSVGTNVLAVIRISGGARKLTWTPDYKKGKRWII